ncbi:MAG: DEAD/DEAH box helicase family protein [Anaerolineales bacterium]|nr:MAG: DEAD/DEAH box helicase family protein [Anaerolineales bacterium]
MDSGAKFLYEDLNTLSNWGNLPKTMPDSVARNLNPRYELRPYQVEAFARFFHCHKNDFPNKTYPLHFLFNMATGSGKTLIMAGAILYLYEQGYRNFLFFVNSTNIIEKTKDNFLNPASIKFLFNPDINIGNRRVRVSAVENFEAVNANDINICFTTIQKLHSDLTNEKENSLTFEDFRKHRIVLIADEAHHMNVQTKAKNNGGDIQAIDVANWENTVEGIFQQNPENLLLEFTATHDYQTPAMVEKYRNMVIFRYDLPEFRNDKFSKDVTLVYSDFDLNERILQALILSQYKQEVAAKHRVNLKPVILLKAQKTIAQSQENKANFHKLIEGLTAKQITKIRMSDVEIVQRAFHFFDGSKISDQQLAERLKREFHEDFCLSVNDEKEKENYQILVNTLEDRNNHIRAIFAVQKLNEGWDVLNLFDIVRCYETRDSRSGFVGNTTVSEAQLIGRGARYFPFVLPENNDRFRRKFDGDIEHELRVIEELHYHSINNPKYIYEIRKALVEQGMMDEHTVERKLTLKDKFKKTDFYKYGLVYVNGKLENDYQYVKSFADLGVKRRNYVHAIATGHGGSSALLVEGKQKVVVSDETRRDVKLSEIEKNVIQSALARNPFFTFENVNHYFPHVKTMNQFIQSEQYLGGLEITFEGNLYQFEENRAEKLYAVMGLLGEVEAEVRQQITDFRGSKEFTKEWVRDIFKDKVLKFDKNNDRIKDEDQFEHFVSSRDWFAFNTVYGTSEEKDFVRMLDRFMDTLQKKYEEMYLVRNEGHFAIYDFAKGRPFQPDFVLFLKEKSGNMLTYQLFIEPKGKFLKEHDKWKETFLKEITEEFGNKVLTLAGKSKYRLIGVPFYDNENENLFKESLDLVL